MRSAQRVAFATGLALLADPAIGVTRRVPSVYPTIQASITAAVSGDSVLVPPGTGRAYGYGVLLTPPYVFTGVGEDTLSLNGLPLLPLRSPGRPPEGRPQPVDFRIEKTRPRAVAAGIAAGGGIAGLEAAAAVFRAEPDVEDVQVVEALNHVRVKFSCFPEPVTFHLPFTPEPPEIPVDSTTARESEHRIQIDRFKRAMDSGRALLFGSNYRTWLSRAATTDLVAQLDSVRAGTLSPAKHQLRSFLEDVRRVDAQTAAEK